MEKITNEEKNTPLYKLRHSLAHIMAQAVLQLHPQAKLGFGPPIEHGFYYDFDFQGESIGEEEFKEIEKRMKKIIKEKQEFQQFEKPLDEAVALLAEQNQDYKIEHAHELVESGKAENGKIGFYVNGPFVDMCEGPHLEHTGEVPKNCFKLDKIAGSYWKGDENRPMLTRIYALAFENKEQLKDYIKRRELALQRNHRKLGSELDIFFIDEEVGVGLPLWMPNGCVIRDELEKWAKEEEFRAGYQRVSTPTLTRSNLYLKSGHLPYYSHSMFPKMTVDKHDEYYIRPMNCPHHHKIYDSRPRSYRDLPLRLAEYGNCYRYEKHGSLSGLLRVRAMCMNDAHIYCEYDQVKEEFNKVIQMYDQYYSHLRIGNLRVRLSLHDPDRDKYIGDKEEWLRSEQIVREVLDANNIDYDEEAGEAAFYGPKLDIQLKNLLGREETISTCQLDFVMARRFGLKYKAQDGADKEPYIIHRAPLGTHERIISFLIEYYGGAFPTWLAPMQLRIVPVGDDFLKYAEKVAQQLRENFIRVEVDTSPASFNKKIRNAITQKTPNIWIVGQQEVENNTVTWRRYAVKKQLTASLEQASKALVHMRDERLMDNFADVEIPFITP